MMKKVNFGYSVKNILISSERTYLLQRMEKVESNTDGNEIENIWKVHFNNNNSINNNEEKNTDWYGLKSP